MLALPLTGPQRPQVHSLALFCSAAGELHRGAGAAGTAPLSTLRHALSGEFIGFPGSCSLPARGAAQGGPRARAAEFRAGPARRGAAGGGRFRLAENFPSSWGEGLARTGRPMGWKAATRRVQCLRRGAGLGFPLRLRCGSASPRGPPCAAPALGNRRRTVLKEQLPHPGPATEG